MSDTTDSSAASVTDISPPTRRTAVQLLTAAVGFLVVAVPTALAGLFFLDPLFPRRKRGGSENAVAGPEGFVKLRVNTEIVPDDGTPMSVTVVTDLTDAWNMYKDEPIGSIWLRRKSDGTIVAFNATCPHLGCSVDFRSSEEEFYCPCHTSAFDLDGSRKNRIPPRGMDDLEIITATNGEQDPSGTELWVRYQDFRGATEEKIPV